MVKHAMFGQISLADYSKTFAEKQPRFHLGETVYAPENGVNPLIVSRCIKIGESFNYGCNDNFAHRYDFYQEESLFSFREKDKCAEAWNYIKFHASCLNASEMVTDSIRSFGILCPKKIAGTNSHIAYVVLALVNDEYVYKGNMCGGAQMHFCTDPYKKFEEETKSLMQMANSGYKIIEGAGKISLLDMFSVSDGLYVDWFQYANLHPEECDTLQREAITFVRQ